jgi:hypothetical protein
MSSMYGSTMSSMRNDWNRAPTAHIGTICRALTAYLAMLVACLAVAPGDAAADASAFCKQRIVHDYLEPLRQMPRLHEAPSSGHLPFAPERVSVAVLNDGLRVGKGLIGFGFADEAPGRRRLEWTVESSLMRVSRAGDVKATMQSKTVHLGTEIVDDIGGTRFFVSGRPAFYRVDLVIRTRHGRVLGRYGAYFRVVGIRSKSRVTLSAEVLAPGQTLFARVENLGTESISPQSVFSVERAEEGGWTEISTAATPGLKPEIRAVLPGGEASRCARYQLPSNLAPGTYRVSNQVSLPRRGSREVLSTHFRVGA